jgi:hypothetical protein
MAMDVFRTGNAVSETPAAALVAANTANSVSPCIFSVLGEPLRLDEAVNRALCNNPRTREAWANVKVQAGGVGAAKAAYLPNVSATWQEVRDDSVTDVSGYPRLSSANRSTVHSGSVSLNWVLYDFGGRQAALRNAQELLAAARANQDATLQITVSRQFPISCRHRPRTLRPPSTGQRQQETCKQRSARLPPIWVLARLSPSFCPRSKMASRPTGTSPTRSLR